MSASPGRPAQAASSCWRTASSEARRESSIRRRSSTADLHARDAGKSSAGGGGTNGPGGRVQPHSEQYATLYIMRIKYDIVLFIILVYTYYFHIKIITHVLTYVRIGYHIKFFVVIEIVL